MAMFFRDTRRASGPVSAVDLRFARLCRLTIILSNMIVPHKRGDQIAKP
jgi:hypothetical protein